MKKPPLLPGAILMGAQSRLLPPSLPFMFFASAMLFHVAGWAALVWAGAAVPGYVGGPGPVLAAIHAMTLGVFVSTAMGAALQLLPVATGVAPRALFLARAIWWIHTPGLLVLLVGFFRGEPAIMLVGAVATTLGLAIFALIIADLIRRATTLRLATSFVWLALLSLVALVALGIALAADLDRGFLPDHPAIAALHMTLAGYGFMGMLALGFSGILVPMFALSPAPSAATGWASLALSTAALAAAAFGLTTGRTSIVAAGTGIGLIAAAFHLRNMLWSLAHGMRKNLGLSFVMVKLAWILLPVGLLLGGALALGWLDTLKWLGGRGPALFGFVMLYGWLLTFVLGILQRIVPFLAAMNMSKRGRKPPRLSELASGWMLKLHVACHAAALALVAPGIALDMPVLVRLGALAGMVGAVGFAAFGGTVIRNFIAYHRVSDTPA